jgi:DNA-binding SARP family transcriptional activator
MTYTEAIMPFLKQGLDYIRQGRDSEGVALLELARKQLAATQTRIAPILDIFVRDSVEYQHAWHTLQEASVRFAKAYAEQQARITMFTDILPALLQELENHLAELAARDTTPPTSSISRSDALTTTQKQPLAAPPVFPEPSNHEHAGLPALFIICFRHFEVRRTGQVLKLCASRKGQGILRYLAVQPEHRATIDSLMNVFWPDDEPEAAQGKLHIAISALRRSLNAGYSCEPGAGYILCKNHSYMLNPAVSIQTDVEQFVQAFQTGQKRADERLASYERACQLYTGPFLAEDLYADWSFLQREQLSHMYLTMCRTLADNAVQQGWYEEAITWTTAILQENRCDEAAHCQLMRIYAMQGRRSEAIEQYQRCERILHEELGMKPLPETTNLLHTLLMR